MRVRMTVNGTPVEHDVEPRLLLVQYLRDVVGLMDTAAAAVPKRSAGS